MNKLFDLSGQVAVVTGGGGVLCGALSRALAKEKASVAILDLQAEAAQRVAEDILREGGKAMPLEANVLSRESLEKYLSAIMKKFGHVDNPGERRRWR